MRSLQSFFVAFGIYICLFGLSPLAKEASSQEEDVRERKLKAAFVYNFAKYTEWPARVFHNEAENLKLCHIGLSPVYWYLKELEGRSVHSRQIKVAQISGAMNEVDCHIVFLPGNEWERTSEFIKTWRYRPVLTISDIPDVADIGLIKHKETVQFEVNLKRAKRKGLKLSAQMLKVAVKVVRD
jgi:hypothetical protein